MKYRHEYHAGNFADVHKHITLLALLAALRRKDKGFLYLETHAGRGAYDVSGPAGESASGIGRLEAHQRASGAQEPFAEEIRDYLARVELLRRERAEPRLYPGSPLLAMSELRPVDRAVFIESQPPKPAPWNAPFLLRHKDVPGRRRWPSLGQKPRFLTETALDRAGARIQRT